MSRIKPSLRWTKAGPRQSTGLQNTLANWPTERGKSSAKSAIRSETKWFFSNRWAADKSDRRRDCLIRHGERSVSIGALFVAVIFRKCRRLFEEFIPWVDFHIWEAVKLFCIFLMSCIKRSDAGTDFAVKCKTNPSHSHQHLEGISTPNALAKLCRQRIITKNRGSMIILTPCKLRLCFFCNFNILLYFLGDFMPPLWSLPCV